MSWLLEFGQVTSSPDLHHLILAREEDVESCIAYFRLLLEAAAVILLLGT